MGKKGIYIRDFLLLAVISMSLSMGFVYGYEIETLQAQTQDLQFQIDILQSVEFNTMVNKKEEL